MSTDTRLINQIDHVVIQKKFKKLEKDLNAVREEQVRSDHSLLKIKTLKDKIRYN